MNDVHGSAWIGQTATKNCLSGYGFLRSFRSQIYTIYIMHIYIHTFIHKCIYIDIHFYKLKNSKNYGNKLFKKVKFLKR